MTTFLSDRHDSDYIYVAACPYIIEIEYTGTRSEQGEPLQQLIAFRWSLLYILLCIRIKRMCMPVNGKTYSRRWKRGDSVVFRNLTNVHNGFDATREEGRARRGAIKYFKIKSSWTFSCFRTVAAHTHTHTHVSTARISYVYYVHVCVRGYKLTRTHTTRRPAAAAVAERHGGGGCGVKYVTGWCAGDMGGV